MHERERERPLRSVRLHYRLRCSQAKRTVRFNMDCGPETCGCLTKKEALCDAIAKAHHSFPCTAMMVTDPETKEPILYIGGFTIREEVEKALEKTRNKS
jgi:hypothetical protein